MYENFTPLGEIQKLLTFHPFKTYRLFVRLKKENKLIEEQDWVLRDNKYLIDLPRFYTEVAAIGFKNFKRDESISNHTQTPESINADSASISNQDGIDDQEKIRADENSQLADDSKTHTDESISNHTQTPSYGEQQDGEANILHAIITGLEKDKEHFKEQSIKLLELNQALAEQNRELTEMTHLLVAPKKDQITEEQEGEINNESAQEPTRVGAVNES